MTLVILLLSMTPAYAEKQVYQGVGEYFMEDESIDSAKTKAERMAARDALEQVKLYVKSRSTSRNSQLILDEIIVIAAGILHIMNTKFKIDEENGQCRITATVTADIDIEKLERLLERAVKERLPND